MDTPKHNSSLEFIVKDAKLELPSQKDNGGWAIAFEPGTGFIWCNYANGSRTWRSPITGNRNLDISYWLKMKIEVMHDDPAKGNLQDIIDLLHHH